MTGRKNLLGNRKRLGELLIEKEVITQQQLKTALYHQRTTGKKLGEILVSQNLISETKMAEVLQEQLGIPFVDLSRIKIDPKLTEFVPFMLAKGIPLFNKTGGRKAVYSYGRPVGLCCN